MVQKQSKDSFLRIEQIISLKGLVDKIHKENICKVKDIVFYS